MKRLIERLRDDFELFLFAYFWSCAAILAAVVGRPLLGAIGLVTVAPFLALASTRRRR